MKFAVLADIHGNADALRAVLADLDRHSLALFGAGGGIDQLFVLGDVVLLGPDPREVVELLMAVGCRDATACRTRPAGDV